MSVPVKPTNKRSNLVRKFVNYGQKGFITFTQESRSRDRRTPRNSVPAQSCRRWRKASPRGSAASPTCQTWPPTEGGSSCCRLFLAARKIATSTTWIATRWPSWLQGAMTRRSVVVFQSNTNCIQIYCAQVSNVLKCYCFLVSSTAIVDVARAFYLTRHGSHVRRVWFSVNVLNLGCAIQTLLKYRFWCKCRWMAGKFKITP